MLYHSLIFLLNVYKNNSSVLGEIYLNLIVQWHDENIKLRGFKSPISVRNIYNDINDNVVSILLETCRKNSFIFQKYFFVVYNNISKYFLSIVLVQLSLTFIYISNLEIKLNLCKIVLLIIFSKTFCYRNNFFF